MLQDPTRKLVAFGHSGLFPQSAQSYSRSETRPKTFKTYIVDLTSLFN